MIDFRSDNTASVNPAIMQALLAVNTGTEASYGADRWSRRLDERYSALFERPVTVFPVATGTAANALALATVAHPWGGIYCHEAAHIHTSEGGATEFFSAGAKLVPLAGEGFRLQAATLAAALARAGIGQRHKPQPAAVSVTQASEYGTVYRLGELQAIGAAARAAGMRMHMDGARFANALVTLGVTPAAMTWQAGVDILSFGATKNGAMNTEAIVVFDPALAEDLSYRLRRAGQTWSKMRFAAAQLLAYVEDDLYLASARRANALAARLAAGLERLSGARLLAPVEANLVFVELPETVIDELAAEGMVFARRDTRLIRLVCRFDGSEAEVDTFIAAAARHLAAHAL